MPNEEYRITTHPGETFLNMTVLEALVRAQTRMGAPGLSAVLINGVRATAYVEGSYATKKISLPAVQFSINIAAFLLQYGARSVVTDGKSTQTGGYKLHLANSRDDKPILVALGKEMYYWLNVDEIRRIRVSTFHNYLGFSINAHLGLKTKSRDFYPVLGYGTLTQTLEQFGWDRGIFHPDLVIS